MKKKKKIDLGDILKKERLKFKSEKELERYYYKKFKERGYEKGFKLFGINISKIYHKERHNSSFKLLDPKKQEIILDAGCGTGELTKRIAKKCKKAIGIDISKSAIAIARKKAPKNCIFKYGNIEKIKFPNKYFDKIVCVETLEHILYPKKALKEFKRTLKDKGKLVLCVPTIDQSIVAKFEKFLGIRDLYPVSEHLHEWDYKRIKNLVEKKGFRFIKAIGICFDIGQLRKISQLNKTMAILTLKFVMSIKVFPKNSVFISMLFKKRKS